LKKISISHNHLHSFIVLSKLECLSQIKTLEIWNNEILKSRNLKSFVVYRFQYLTEFNQHKIDDRDKKIAKMNFHVFDRLLSMDIVSMPVTPVMDQSKTSKHDFASLEAEKNEIKMKTKRNAEFSKTFVEALINDR